MILPTTNLPKAVDWRNTGAVTPAVNQHTCGSCWAFTTAACLESYNKIAGGGLMRLSPQQLVDCASNQQWGSFGCEGGFVDYAFTYSRFYPLMEEAYYPYKNVKGSICSYAPSLGRVQVKDNWKVPANDKE